MCLNDGLEFETGILAAKYYGISGSTVNRCLDGHVSRGGLRFARKLD